MAESFLNRYEKSGRLEKSLNDTYHTDPKIISEISRAAWVISSQLPLNLVDPYFRLVQGSLQLPSAYGYPSIGYLESMTSSGYTDLMLPTKITGIGMYMARLNFAMGQLRSGLMEKLKVIELAMSQPEVNSENLTQILSELFAELLIDPATKPERVADQTEDFLKNFNRFMKRGNNIVDSAVLAWYLYVGLMPKIDTPSDRYWPDLLLAEGYRIPFEGEPIGSWTLPDKTLNRVDLDDVRGYEYLVQLHTAADLKGYGSKQIINVPGEKLVAAGKWVCENEETPFIRQVISLVQWQLENFQIPEWGKQLEK